MYILLRDEEEAIRSGMEMRGYPVMTMPEDVYVGSPVAVVLLNPMLDEIRSEFEAIRLCGSATRVLVITDSRHGYLISKIFPEAYVICGDDGALCSSIEKAIIGKAREPGAVPRLTASERHLLHEIGYGMSNKELAARMNRSERTIRRIKESLLMKTGLVSSEQLLLYALYRINSRSSSRI